MKNLSKKLLAGLLSVAIAGGCAVSSFAAGVLYGDTNGNSQINSADALEVLRHSVGQKILEGDAFTRSDVNFDGVVDSSDALKILLYSVGKISSFSVTADEALKNYSDAIKNARESKPFYRYRTDTVITDADIDVKDSFILDLMGTPAEEMEKEMLDELNIGETETAQSYCKQGSDASFNNLPPLCKLTDTSKFKSVTATELGDGKRKLEITLKDEKNPSADSVVCNLLGATSYDEMLASLEESTEVADGVSVDVNLKELSYKNCWITCVVDTSTGEISELEWNTDIYMSYSVKMIVEVSSTMETSVKTSYWDFQY